MLQTTISSAPALGQARASRLPPRFIPQPSLPYQPARPVSPLLPRSLAVPPRPEHSAASPPPQNFPHGRNRVPLTGQLNRLPPHHLVRPSLRGSVAHLPCRSKGRTINLLLLLHSKTTTRGSTLKRLPFPQMQLGSRPCGQSWTPLGTRRSYPQARYRSLAASRRVWRNGSQHLRRARANTWIRTLLRMCLLASLRLP